MKNINSVMLKRISYLVRQFRTRKLVKASSVAKDYEVSEKTIYRDLELLKTEYAAPIEYDFKTKSYFYSKPFKLNAFDFTINELYNLAIIRELVKSSDSNPFKTGQKSIFNKLVMSFGDDIKNQIRTVSEKVSFKFKPVRKLDDKVFKAIEKALFEERTINIDYFMLDENRNNQRTIDPYHLKNFEGNWYLIGYNHSKNKIRIMAMNRIKKVTLSNKYFDIPEEFDIKKYFKDSFANRRTSKMYNVEIVIKQEFINQILESKIHPSQKLIELANGDMSVSLKVNELLEIKNWILSKGSKIFVQSPPELIKMITKEAASILKLYH